MFGVVLAAVYVLLNAATPSAAACAESRRYPVIRDRAVPIDIIAVSRMNVPRASIGGAAPGSGSRSSVV